MVDDWATELPARLQEIATFLTTQFSSQQISYQLSASYWLTHRDRGDRQRWVGSFFARDSAAASLSGAVFLNFDPATFVREALRHLTEQHIYRALTVNFTDSAWHFEQLISVIVQCQLLLPVDHPFLLQHDLQRLRARPARRRRRHVTLVPFEIAGASRQGEPNDPDQSV